MHCCSCSSSSHLTGIQKACALCGCVGAARLRVPLELPVSAPSLLVCALIQPMLVTEGGAPEQPLVRGRGPRAGLLGVKERAGLEGGGERCHGQGLVHLKQLCAHITVKV